MKILLLGIGNILFGDEGIGVHISNLLKVNYEFSGENIEVDIIDGGTLAQILIPLITSYDRVVIFDCVSVNDANVGDVYFFDFDNVPNIITWSGSAHEVEMLQTLKMTQINGDLPPVKVVGIVPEIIGTDTSFSLSKSVIDSSKTMEDIAIKYLKELGVTVKKTKNEDIQSIAQYSYRGY